MKIDLNETELIGKWIMENGKIKADFTCERIEQLTTKYLNQIAGEGWEILFQDPKDGRYWEKFYPQGEIHGGGPPALKCLSTKEAKDKYGDI